MENNKPQNPPAFPALDNNGVDGLMLRHEGMTLRDYFAAKAMALCFSMKGEDRNCHQEAAKWSYEIADAMLNEREK